MAAVLAVLGWADYFCFALMLLISAGIGIYFRFSGGQQRTTEEFLLAGRNMSILPVAFSLMASSFSANTILGVPAEMYMFGTHLAFLNVGNVAGFVISAYLFLPVFFKVQVTTAYEYLERRFGKKARLITSFTFVPQTMLSMSLFLYAPALALSAVTSLSTWTSAISVGFVCTFYCTLGGMKAVLWTDVFQAVLMYLCLLAVLIKGCMDVGGIGNVFRIANEGGRLQLPGVEIDPRVRYTVWNVFLQGCIISMSSISGNQIQIQRLLTVKDIQRSRAALFLSIPIFVAFSLMSCLAGLVIYANLAGCDPLTSEEKPISSADKLLPYYVMKSLGHIPGLPGVCICGIFSAALSSASSAVNSLTAVTMEDFVKPFCTTRKISRWKVAILAKAITLFYGLLCVSLIFLVANFGGLVQASYTVYGMFAGPVFGVFFLAMMTTRSNEKGVIVGLVTSVTLTAWISFGASASATRPRILPLSTSQCIYPTYNYTVPEKKNFSLLSSHFNYSEASNGDEEGYIFPLYTISYMWFTVIGFLTSVIVGYISSVCINIFSGKSPIPETEYLSPLVVWSTTQKVDDESKNKHITSNQRDGNEETDVSLLQ